MHKIVVYREKKKLGHFGVKKLLRRAVNAALEAEGVAERCYINIMLTDDEGIHAINREQRNIDRPTDVLSFPMNELKAGEFDSRLCDYDPRVKAIMLGDMVLSLERCMEQSKEYGHSFDREVSYLCVHSVLHLLGYDHLDEGEMKAQMRSREDAIMVKIGL